ncbi:hypothetical protein BpHYR1_032895 [Brachionus plicatilis]|uniref:Uncharacterized protein n=1 Tax=Brachionus plicatilis TaxID=10195 RepID=A0A3M7QKZ8_BRAPC|nr:hypothetical protein BpHYR1_032895 [Brachionus plicatilis]
MFPKNPNNSKFKKVLGNIYYVNNFPNLLSALFPHLIYFKPLIANKFLINIIQRRQILTF